MREDETREVTERMKRERAVRVLAAAIREGRISTENWHFCTDFGMELSRWSPSEGGHMGVDEMRDFIEFPAETRRREERALRWQRRVIFWRAELPEWVRSWWRRRWSR